MKKIIITFISIILVILIVDLIIYKNNNEYTKFKLSLDKTIGKNVYEVISIDKSLEIINNESGILLFATNDDLDYVEYLNDLTKDFNIDKIYYINMSNNTDNKDIILALENNIELIDDIIKTPFLLTVKNGELKNITILSNYTSSELDKKIIKIFSTHFYESFN